MVEGHVPKLCKSHRGRVRRNHKRLAPALLEVAARRVVDGYWGRQVGWLAGSDERLEATNRHQERASRLARLPLHPVYEGGGSLDFPVGARVVLAPGQPGSEIEWPWITTWAYSCASVNLNLLTGRPSSKRAYAISSRGLRRGSK